MSQGYRESASHCVLYKYFNFLTRNIINESVAHSRNGMKISPTRDEGRRMYRQKTNMKILLRIVHKNNANISSDDLDNILKAEHIGQKRVKKKKKKDGENSPNNL